MRSGLVEIAVTVKLPAAVSASRTVNDTCPPAPSSLIVWGGMREMVGRTLADDRTVRTKLRVTTALPPPPSVTVTLITAEPVELFTGRKKSVPVGFGLV